MNTINIVLMIILSAMIGFAIGNVWGKETMKRMLGGLLDQLTKNMKAAANEAKKKGD